MRKQKRVRTNFTPHQLLKLEEAFEVNKYVVGQERKLLARKLHLSETQVNHFNDKNLKNNYFWFIYRLKYGFKIEEQKQEGQILLPNQIRELQILELNPSKYKMTI